MKIYHLVTTAFTACSVLAVLAPATVRAQEASPSPAQATSRVDPQALEALKRMSTTLGAAKALTYRSRTIVEVPAKTGQFITLFSTAEVALKRPESCVPGSLARPPISISITMEPRPPPSLPEPRSIPRLKPRRQSTPWSLRCSRRLVSASFPPPSFSAILMAC